MADVILYLAFSGFGFVLGAVGLMKSGKVFAVPAFVGALMLAYTFVGVGSDGNITNAGNTILSASLNSGMWQAALILPLLLMVMDFLIAGYRGFGKL